MEEYEIPAEQAEWLLKRWYHLPLLDLMTTTNFQSNSIWIATRLGISVTEVEAALKTLVDENLAILDQNGAYKKKHLKIRFPTTISKSVIREHHKAQMKRAKELLETRMTPKDFNNRLIVGLSVACNPQYLQEVKEYLHAALYEAAEILSRDPCAEVYQINLQLFPHTK